MRNLFDQYAQPENRLTHALVCTLNSDRSLLRPFLRWAGAADIPDLSRLRITQQQIPGELISGDESDGRGLPDACVFDPSGWALIVEAKVQSGVSLNQLRRHIATAQRHGFSNLFLLLLSVDSPPQGLPDRTTVRAWRDVYCWFRTNPKAKGSSWSRVLTDYMEIFEARMLALDYSIRGTITMFDGLRFGEDNPYTYSEGKRLIRLLGDELKKRKDLRALGIDPEGSGRPALTGSNRQGVWDFIPLKAAEGAGNFTSFPHFTIALNPRSAVAAVTIPHGVRGGFRTTMRSVGEEGFLQLLTRIESNMRPVLRQAEGSRCNVYAVQRHYQSQRSSGEVDAHLAADIRTILPGRRREAKYQPQWARAIYAVLAEKQSNIQFGIEVQLSYDCPKVRTPGAVDLFAQALIALHPLVRFALND